MALFSHPNYVSDAALFLFAAVPEIIALLSPLLVLSVVK